MSNEINKLSEVVNGMNICLPKEENEAPNMIALLTKKIATAAATVFSESLGDVGRLCTSSARLFSLVAKQSYRKYTHTEEVKGLHLGNYPEKKPDSISALLLKRRKETFEKSGGCVEGVSPQISAEDRAAANKAVLSKRQKRN